MDGEKNGMATALPLAFLFVRRKRKSGEKEIWREFYGTCFVEFIRGRGVSFAGLIACATIPYKKYSSVNKAQSSLNLCVITLIIIIVYFNKKCNRATEFFLKFIVFTFNKKTAEPVGYEKIDCTASPCARFSGRSGCRVKNKWKTGRFFLEICKKALYFTKNNAEETLMDENNTDWRSIIFRGIESDELDYKAAQNWHELPRAGRAKFVRHCIAMANTKGGYVVVGVGEDSNGQPALYTGLTEEQSRSFDPTDVGNFINRFADPAVDFTIERPVIDGKQYVVFVIRRFRNIPHVCTSSCENELLLGTFYIRTQDASSRPAYRSSEIHSLLQRALRTQREMLGRMIRGILYEDHSIQENYQQSHFTEEISHSRNFFSKHRERNLHHAFRLSISVAPSEYIAEKFSLSELKNHVKEAFILFPDPVFITDEDLKNAYFTNVSMRMLSADKKRCWQLYQSGLFHFAGIFPLKANGVSYRLTLQLFAEAVKFLAQLYDLLGYSEDLLSIQVSIRDVENVSLTDVPFSTDDFEFTCRIPEIAFKVERSAADLSASPSAHAVYLIKKICERFNLPEGRHRNLQKDVVSYQTRE